MFTNVKRYYYINFDFLSSIFPFGIRKAIAVAL